MSKQIEEVGEKGGGSWKMREGGKDKRMTTKQHGAQK